MSGMDRLTDEQWAVQYLEDDAEACSAVNGSHDQTTKDARRMEVLVKRLIRERDEARRASQAAPAPSDGLREAADRVAYEMWMQLETAGYGEAAGYMQTAWMGECILAALTPAPAQEVKP